MPPKGTPGKKGPRKDPAYTEDDFLESESNAVSAALAESGGSDMNLAFGLAAGAATALVPVFMFQSLLNMPVGEGYNLQAFIGGLLFSAAILALAYRTAAEAKLNQLGRSKEMTDLLPQSGMDRSSTIKREANKAGTTGAALVASKRKEMRAAHQRESMLHALYVVNWWFAGTALFFGFVMFGQMSAPFSYLLTTSLSSVLTSFFSGKV
jgi:hypothetical protein